MPENFQSINQIDFIRNSYQRILQQNKKSIFNSITKPPFRCGIFRHNIACFADVYFLFIYKHIYESDAILYLFLNLFLFLQK